MGAPAGPSKKAIHHRARAYDTFTSSFAPLSLDELVLPPAAEAEGDSVEKVEGLAWLWLVNCGGASLGTPDVAEQTVKGLQGVEDIVEWLYKVSTHLGGSSLAPTQLDPS